MQEVYRINDHAAHKPWRYNRVYYTKSKEVFDILKAHDNDMWDEVDVEELPEDYEGDIRYFLLEDEEFRKGEVIVELEYPHILLGEVTLWSE